ncbi:rapunzel 2 isoform X2 [Thalassophryne amazonica]|uniref:rapunzel 2 isoform X2 n=1 Tax=Thalassophryne amazonica TaxID=390379 RepID=UPI0014715236|nr:rapunzel 2 isoform X2 [Thalassophryne amazonica]
MADAAQIKKTAAKVLCCVEKVSSFASSIDPLFGIVSSLVGVARKGLLDEEGHPLDKDFQEINTKLESISKKNHQCLKQIRIDEVNETFGKYEEFIKHQYSAFTNMVVQIKKDPDNAERYMDNFKNIYERDKSDVSLDVYYRGVMGTSTLFGRSLLKVYMDHCNGDQEIMEHRCSHITHLFHMGLITLMGYRAVTEDDEDEVREKWSKRVADIQKKMQEALSQCKNGTASETSPTNGMSSEKPLTSEKASEKPLTSEKASEKPLTSEKASETSPTSGVLSESPPTSGVLSESPPTSGVLSESPPTSGVLSESPPTSGVLSETPPTSGVLSETQPISGKSSGTKPKSRKLFQPFSGKFFAKSPFSGKSS